MVTVTSSGTKVGIIAPEGLPAYIVAGTNKDLEFTVTKPENADWYDINVWYDDPNGGLYGENGIEGASKAIKISADDLPQFETRVNVKVRGAGYNKEADEQEWHIPIVRGTTENAELTITGLNGDGEIPVNKTADLTITKAQDATGEIETVCVYGEYGPQDHDGPDEDGVYRNGISFEHFSPSFVMTWCPMKR